MSSPTGPSRPIIVIPSRLAATRLPGKPLLEIGGIPLIVHVWRHAVEADVGRVVVACGDRPIADAIAAAGGEAVLTDPDLPSGSDRVHAAVGLVDPRGDHDVVLNLQGDVPTLDPGVLGAVLGLLADPAVDIGTVAAPVRTAAAAADPNVVKAVIEAADHQPAGRALYFTRAAAPSGTGRLLHHLGIYAFRRPALDRFVALPPSALERREGLEQLRALADGMRIDVTVVDTVPIEVNTPEDLEQAQVAIAASASRGENGA